MSEHTQHRHTTRASHKNKHGRHTRTNTRTNIGFTREQTQASHENKHWLHTRTNTGFTREQTWASCENKHGLHTKTNTYLIMGLGHNADVARHRRNARDVLCCDMAAELVPSSHGVQIIRSQVCVKVKAAHASHVPACKVCVLVCLCVCWHACTWC